MKNLFKVAVVAAALTLLVGTAISAPSSKFAATINKVQLVSSSAGTKNVADDLVAFIKVPSQKDLLVGVSLEIAIDTQTKVKGKNGGGGSAIAEGEVVVMVAAEDGDGNVYVAEPGMVVFASREQELSAVLGGVIDSCTVGDDGVIDVDQECVVTEEEINLILKTTAAHHFNFVVPNLPSGEYAVKVYLTANTDATTVDSILDDAVTGANTAQADVVVGPKVVTVQEVRATNNPDGIVIELPE
jgi:hypothetical protein